MFQLLCFIFEIFAKLKSDYRRNLIFLINGERLFIKII